MIDFTYFRYQPYTIPQYEPQGHFGYRNDLKNTDTTLAFLDQRTNYVSVPME